MGGDLNTVLTIEDKKRGSTIRDPIISTLEDIISDWDIVDIKPKKGKYTSASVIQVKG